MVFFFLSVLSSADGARSAGFARAPGRPRAVGVPAVEKPPAAIPAGRRHGPILHIRRHAGRQVRLQTVGHRPRRLEGVVHDQWPTPERRQVDRRSHTVDGFGPGDTGLPGSGHQRYR